MDHPFKVGEKFRNRKGDYEVVSLKDPEMVIRYDSGDELVTTIELQARIWSNIQMEERTKHAAKAPAKKKAPSAKKKSAFNGLEEADFQDGIAGTTWRARGALGGLLAKNLSSSAGQEFQSYAVFRKAEVHLARPQHYDEKRKERSAKFFFSLSPTVAACGFCIEKGSQKMDRKWAWPALLKNLEKNAELQANIEEAMHQHDLQWEIEVADKGLAAKAGFGEEGLFWEQDQDEKVPIGWKDFAKYLKGIKADRWCSVHLCGYMEKEDVIAAGLDAADSAVGVFQALLPLYEVCANP
jgi:hypothetical protein